ncbi:NUDIX hydrolase [Geobacter pickeringii]|uniref:DNA mismatch repair protein MutT n=1 Tax=Geobacter pickeringii TaxID=345632 RepID=A0A0B5BBH5_9BACT|nr:CoA pyrophosphatase [Geobacter pickeringii]AJE02309.1 DNA mismatch repair protein MutT [Geobacter pickeringii]
MEPTRRQGSGWWEAVAERLASREPEIIPAEGRTRAAVALVLAPGPDSPSVLFIERAAHDGDPWSGDLGFPGGKVEPADATTRAAAERETREELGLDLAGARFLGRLSDITGAHLPVLVSCFVYAIDAPPRLVPGAEVRDPFWVPLAVLADRRRHTSATVRFGSESFVRPAIRLPVAEKPVLWGITYRLVTQFLEIVAELLPSPDGGKE